MGWEEKVNECAVIAQAVTSDDANECAAIAQAVTSDDVTDAWYDRRGADGCGK